MSQEQMRYQLMTSRQAGAVAIIQCVGEQVEALACKLSGREGLDVGRIYLADLAGIDEGVVVLLREEVLQIMPHGGPRVVQKLEAWLHEQNCLPVCSRSDSEQEKKINDRQLFSEASCELEALALHAVAGAASPAAIALLLNQKNAWTQWLEHHQGQAVDDEECSAILKQSDLLNHLLKPPMVVVAGPANVGKSTLLNLLTGKATSIVADMPGTTRDWVGSLVELDGQPVGLPGAVVMQWVDTPGLRVSADTVEQAAVGLARTQIMQADVLIALTEPTYADAWPQLGREADLYVVNKCEQLLSTTAGKPQSSSEPLQDLGSRDRPICISALNDLGMSQFFQLVLEKLGFAQLQNESLSSGQLPWAFDQIIRDALKGKNMQILKTCLSDESASHSAERDGA